MLCAATAAPRPQHNDDDENDWQCHRISAIRRVEEDSHLCAARIRGSSAPAPCAHQRGPIGPGPSMRRYAQRRFLRPRHSTLPRIRVYVCPMDPDVRSHNPGTCRRCGMTLVAGIPDPVEFHLDLDVCLVRRGLANPPRCSSSFTTRGRTARRQLQRRAREAVSRLRRERGSGVLPTRPSHLRRRRASSSCRSRFPMPGMFRVLGDFYPAGATPQLVTETSSCRAGRRAPVQLTRDYSAKTSENMRVS